MFCPLCDVGVLVDDYTFRVPPDERGLFCESCNEKFVAPRPDK